MTTRTASLAYDLQEVQSSTTGLWEALRGRRLFITGGTGFFGSWLLESFCHANRVLRLEASAVVLTRDVASFSAKAPHLAADPAIRFVTGDVRTFDIGALHAQGGRDATSLDYVIHAATDASARLLAEEPLRMLDTVAQGTRSALDLARNGGASRFLLASSGAVYGVQPAALAHVSETHAGAPDCSSPAAAYAEGKRIAETMCACVQHDGGPAALIARCFAFVGPYLPLDAHFAIGNFIRDALLGRPIRVGGDGTAVRSYLYASDLATWLWTILLRGRSGRPYNVGSPEAVSIAELAMTVSRVLGGTSPVAIAATAIPGAPAHRYVPDVRRAEAELGLVPRVSLDDGIRRTASWYRDQLHGAPTAGTRD